MPSLNVKQEKNQSFAGYSLPPANSHEIDLFSLIEVLWQAKRRILATVFAFACVGLLLSFLLPQKWTSQAIVTPAESVQWQGLERTLTALRVLDMEVSVDRASVFNLFIKKFSSPSLLEEYLRSSPYVMDQLKGAQIDEQDLHRAIVLLSEKMKAVDSNAGKKNETSLFTSWTLSFTAPTREEAQKVLAGYIQYISDIVVKETLENIRNQLEIANAAGIKRPVYSNGQAVKDDPDFSISLGADGISRKLEIEKGVTDVAEIDGDLRNRQYHVEQLAAMNVSDVKFTPFKYQLSPSLPVKKDGPGKAVIIILAALIGGMMACGGVLLRHAMVSRKMENALAIDERLV
ncbi:LPS O-antigen length regulator [Salmonella enterica subsp. enterica serovar Infantis]|nr:LPS O-antigen length regulator [Salmonella enterica subsp. enterica serovar Infantis]